jgi:HEAT repeat protein
MDKKMSIAAALVLAGASWLQAQSQDVAAYTWVTFHRVHLRNGNYLEGALVGRTDRSVTIRQPWGEILVRNDQIDRVEFVKIKSFKDPEMLVQKRKPAAPKASEISASSDKPMVEASAAAKTSDSGEPVPSSIPAAVVQSVDQAINLWRTAAGAERPDLAQMLTSLGADVAPYLEFLLEKRTQSTPLMPVTLAYVAVSEDRFVDFSERMMASSTMEVREAAITGLSKATSPARIPIVMKAMEDTFPSVWKLATEILLEAARSDSAKSEMVSQIAARVPNSKNTTAFAIALSRIGGRDAHRVLWDLVDNSNETIRMSGLHGIGLLADPEDGPKLVSLFRDPSAMVRKSAILALGKMKYRPATGELVGLLKNEDPGLSANVRWSLREITGQLVADKNEAWTDWWDSIGSKSDLFK